MTEQQACAWLLERDSFLILTHVRPDGDTLGSAVALCRSLQKAGKTAYMQPNPSLTSTCDGFLDYVWAPEGFQAEHIVAVDLADEQLFPEGQECFRGKVELCIDHHPSNAHYAQHLCLVGTAAAAGEVVYRICKGLCELDEPIARALYVAISTDSGGFMYNNTSPETHRIAAELMELTNVAPINKHFFKTKSRKRLEMEALLLQSEEFFMDGRICIGAVTIADTQRVQADKSATEELAAFAAEIEGVECAATIKEHAPELCKLSVRAQTGWVNASDICAHFGGGGHAAAAGGMIHANVTEARKLVYDAILAELPQE